MPHSEQTEEVWSDIREHARLLGDTARTDGLVEFLSRHAPGRRVLEVGCGTGVLSCIAARMGATRVIAVERTAVVSHVRELVAAAKLGDVVEVVHADIMTLEPEPVDLAFSELLNADPFSEGLLEAMDAAAQWVVPGGVLAPADLELHVALVAAADADMELAEARRVVRRLGQTYDLPVQQLLDAINGAPRTRRTVSWVEPRSEPVTVWRRRLDQYTPPPAHTRVAVTATGSGRVSGAAIWFSSRYDEQLVLANPPEEPCHWGIYVSTWPYPIRVELGQRVELDVFMSHREGVDIAPVR